MTAAVPTWLLSAARDPEKASTEILAGLAFSGSSGLRVMKVPNRSLVPIRGPAWHFFCGSGKQGANI